MERRVFVSYSHKDAKWANEVVQGLEALGFRVWKDNKYEQEKKDLESGIAAGDNWSAKIENAIKSCKGFIGLVSDSSSKSKWCEKELVFAEQQADHVNIIIRHREDTMLPDGISYVYTNNSHIVWSETDNDSVWSAIEANKEFMAIREGIGTVDEIQSPMVKRINEHLKTDWERHRSFLLMKSLDRSLLPTGNFIRNQDSMVVNEHDERKPFAEFIEESWLTQTHLFIEGTGGVGKSVSLLTFVTERGFLPVNVAAVYIPMNRLSDGAYSGTECIDKFLKRKLADDEFDWIERHSKSEWHGKTNVILLLDGYNEVPPDKRFDVDRSIDDWSERSGVQIVTTSRFNASFNNKCFKRIRLLELDRSTVARFLSSNGMELPEETSKIWDVINTPLMLKIYVEVGVIARDANKDYLSFKSSDSAGSLIWNYTLKEVDKCIGNKGSYEAIEYAMAILLVAPYVCWKMERNYLFTIDESQWSQYVDEGVEYWSGRDYPAYFEKIEDGIESYAEEIKPRKQKAHIKKIFTEITSVFNRTSEVMNRTIYSLMHQNFRDGLAAMHLNNIALTSNGMLPDEFKDSLSEYVVDYLADIMEGDAIQGVWEGNRKRQPTHIVATHNLLRLVHKKHDGSLASLDWSGMDLRGVNLFGYRKGLRLDLSKESGCFTETKIDTECFKPEGHTGRVHCIAYSPDGRRIASGSKDKTIRIWDAETHRQIGEPLEGHEEGVNCIAYSLDGRRIASGSYDKTIRIWDAETHRQIGEPLEGHKSGINSIAYSPDGRRIASGSRDKTIRIWDAETHRQIGEPLKGNKNGVSSIAYSPDGRRIASGSGDLFDNGGKIRIWDADMHQLVGEPLDGYVYFGECIAYSSDFRWIATGSRDRTIRFWDMETHRQIGESLKGYGDRVMCISYSLDGRRIASGSNDGTICIWDAETHRQIGEPLEGCGGRAICISYSPDGRHIASLIGLFGDGGMIRIWDAETYRQTGKLLVGKWCERVTTIAYSPDGRHIASGSDALFGDGGMIRIWDVETHMQVGDPLEGHEGWVTSIAYSPDSYWIVGYSIYGIICIWDSKTYECVDKIKQLFGIDLSGLDFSLADINDESKKILYQNGVEVSNDNEKDIA